MKLFAFFGLLLIASGCCSNKISHIAVREFQQRHPEEFKRYTFIYPITLATHMALAADRMSDVCAIADKLQKEYGSDPAISEFARNIIRQENVVREKAVRSAKELESLKGDDGAICQFEWSDGSTKEVGLLVIRKGRVLKRDVWFAEYLKEEPEELSSGVGLDSTVLSHDRRSGEHLEWSIPESRISKTPRWNPTHEQVPLSVRDALAISCSWVKRKTEGGACDLEEICIRPFAYESNAFTGIYYYKIMYGVRSFDNLPCILLMDGSVVEPKSTWPK